MSKSVLEDEIRALEKRRFEAMCAGDIATLEACLHGKMSYTHSSGIVDTKQSYLAGVREKRWDYKSIRASEERITIFEESALVLCRLQIEVLAGGIARSVDSLALTVWVKEQGRWQVAAVHSTSRPT